MIKSYRDLRVWQEGMDLAVVIHDLTVTFPDHERFGITNRMRTVSSDIPSEIAMGHTLETTKDYLWHIDRAQAYLAKLQTQLELSGRHRYLTQQQVDSTLDRTVVLAKQL